MFQKIENLIILNKYRKLFESIGKRIQVFLTQKIVSELSENMDPDPGVKKGPDLGSGFATLLYSICFGYQLMLSFLLDFGKEEADYPLLNLEEPMWMNSSPPLVFLFNHSQNAVGKVQVEIKSAQASAY